MKSKYLFTYYVSSFSPGFCSVPKMSKTINRYLIHLRLDKAGS